MKRANALFSSLPQNKMSTSIIKICNLALSHIGASSIISLLDPTTESRQCNLLYDVAREYVLQAHTWGFAERRARLAQLSVEPFGYSYAYQYPTGCLLAREIFQEIKTAKPIDYAVVSQDSETSKMILTDQPDAVLVYTANISDTNMFSPTFITTLSYKLASDLAKPVTGDENIGVNMLRYYGAFLDQAKLADATERKEAKKQKKECDLLLARQ